MKAVIYRTIGTLIELPDGMFTYDTEMRIPAGEVSNYLGDNEIPLSEDYEIEEEREVIVLEEE